MAAGAILLTVVALVPAAVAVAGGSHEGAVNTTDGVAIRGYDTVAYFTTGEPARGSEAYVVEWDGAEWRFASAEHRDLFSADPERYAPRYGGHCAYAAARNQIADGDPLLWTIHDGRLYLNLNSSVERRFRESIESEVAAAEANWPALRARLSTTTSP